MRKLLFLSLTLGSFVVTAFGQQPTATPPEDQVVRISTDLIQIDVTVIDKNGKSVPGLVADDFEVYENGEKQNLSGAYFMTRSMGGATIGGTPASVTRNAATPGSTTVTQLSPGSVRRTIAIVVDDLNMSFGSIYYARRALRQFVEQQMEPGDLVAIIRTAGAVGALQQFTSDKQLLLAAIESIRWNPLTADADALASVGQTPQDIT